MPGSERLQPSAQKITPAELSIKIEGEMRTHKTYQNNVWPLNHIYREYHKEYFVLMRRTSKRSQRVNLKITKANNNFKKT